MLNYVGCVSLPASVLQGKERRARQKEAQRKKVTSPGVIIPIVMFSVVGQGNSHKKNHTKTPLCLPIFPAS